MGDFTRLLEAKKGELMASGIAKPSERAARKVVKEEELMKFCRRHTRKVEETTRIIEQLLLSLSLSWAMDTLEVPVLKQELRSIWSEQKKHIHVYPVHPRPPRYLSIRHCRPPGERRGAATSPPMCQMLHLSGELPPASGQV